MLVLERRDRLGGAAETSELGGARVPRLAHTVGRLRPSVVRDLDLRSHGLRLVAPDVRVFAPAPDGRAVTLWTDQARTVEGLRAWSPADADAYPDFDRLVRSLGRFIGEIAAQTPPDIQAPGLGDALTGLKLGRTFRGLGKHDAHTILRVLPMAVADFVAESFETDAVQAALAWRGVQYCSLGPWSAGSAAVLLFDAAGNDGGAAGQTVFAEGGPGALSEALAAAARAAGAEIRCGAEVAAITSRDGAGDGRRAGVRRGDRGVDRDQRARPEADARRAVRPGRRRAVDALAGRQLPDAGRRVEGQPRRRPAAAVHRPPAATTRRCSAAGSSSRPASTRSSGRSTRRSTAGSPTSSSSRRRSRRSSTRRSSRARRPGRTS